MLTVALLTASLPVRPARAEPLEPAPVVHIVPGGSGARDGSDWANAGALPDLPVLARPGARVWLRADLGPYRVRQPVQLAVGGLPGRPTTIEGVDAEGRPRRAVLLGTRAEPYSPKGASGGEVFRLLRGADHLRFQHLAFRNQGHCFRLAGDLTDLAITQAEARNVRRFIENERAGDAPGASVSGLTVRDVQIRGFSKDAIRLRYDTHDVLIEDVLGDSERQDGDDFAEGIALDGTAHDVVIRRVTMRNAHDTANAYWNGDGFATERGNYRIRFEDTVASGNTDAGYDLKSSDTVLIRAAASGNARNFKLWGRGIALQDCIGLAPVLRGGTGDQDQIEVVAGAAVTVAGCRFVDGDPATTTFRVQEGAVLTVSGTTVVRHPRAAPSAVAPGGRLDRDP